MSSEGSCGTTKAVSAPTKSARDDQRFRFAFVLGIVGAAIATASACSLTNLDPYTAGGGVVDTGATADATGDVKTDVRTDSTKADDGTDGAQDTATDDGGDDTRVTDSTLADGSDAGDAGDASDAADGDARDAADSTLVDSVVADTGGGIDTAPGDVGVDPDAPCGVGVGRFGFSEFMPRAVAGSGDKHEWIEITNYDACPIDVSGVTVKVSSATAERASFTFPPGTTLTAGEALIVADDSSVFATDVTGAGDAGVIPIGKVFNFASVSGDVIVNSTAIFRLYAPGSTAAYEDVTVSAPSAGWAPNRSMAYPVPSSTCPASGRYSTPTGGSLSAAWKNAAIDPSQEYGSTGSPAVTLYGTPTKPNNGISCP